MIALETLAILQCASGMRAAHVVAALNEGGFALENRQSLLKALDLGLAPCLAFLICLWLCDAALLNLAIIFKHRRELVVSSVSVRRQFGDGLVERNCFGGFVFSILLFHGLADIRLS